MKAKDLAKSKNFSAADLNHFLKGNTDFNTTNTTFGGIQFADADAESVSIAFIKYMEAKEAEKQAKIDALAEEKRLAEEAEQRKLKALSEMLITSGFNFDGYTVNKYSGYISGDDAVQIDRGHEGIFSSAVDVGDALMDNLSVIRRNALLELKEQAYALGCNAIIGVDFDYLTLDPETVNAKGGTLYMPYVFGVTANGNAVIISKNN